MNRYLRYALLALVWGAVAAYILYAGTTAQRLRAARTIGKVEIEVVDSSSMGYLVSGRMVRGWIAHSGIKTKGTAVDKVPLTQIEEMIARNGFVERVDAYVTYDGVLHVDISQRRPLVRLLVDGVDSYVTAEGYVFAAPRASSLYVPVVTGSYRPPFPAGYAGSVRAHIDTESAKVDKRIAELERELGIQIQVVDTGGWDFCEAVLEENAVMTHRRRQMYEQTDCSNCRPAECGEIHAI